LYSPQVGSFKGGMSLTLVTFFFETSKLWANILALVGVECQRPRLEPEKAIGTHRALPRLPSTRLGCHVLYKLYYLYILYLVN
jgi:hypothetical protein